jgi:hypothetical protein
MRFTGHLARMVEMHINFVVGMHKESDYLGDLSVDGSIILKFILG